MKRKTVTPNLPVLLPMIKKKYRSYVVFAKEIRGKDKSGWVTEWSRGSNYPSPEEAARICIFLNTTPGEILMREGETPEKTAKCLEDIETVRKLVEAERAKENAHDPKTVGVSDTDSLIAGIQNIADYDTAFAVLDALNKRMQELK